MNTSTVPAARGGFTAVELLIVVIALAIILTISLIVMHRRTAAQATSELFGAVYDNDADHVRKLLRAGANPDIIDSSGMTPLHFAIDKRMTCVAELLIDADADLAFMSTACKCDAVLPSIPRRSPKPARCVSPSNGAPMRDERPAPVPTSSQRVRSSSGSIGRAP